MKLKPIIGALVLGLILLTFCGPKSVDPVQQRFEQQALEVGVEYKTENVFGDVIVLNDGSKQEENVFGTSYYFANGDAYIRTVYGYEKQKNAPREIKTQ